MLLLGDCLVVEESGITGVDHLVLLLKHDSLLSYLFCPLGINQILVFLALPYDVVDI